MMLRENCQVIQFKMCWLTIVINDLQIGTGITNALIKTRKAVDKEFAGEAEDVPIVSTSVAYGVYMAVSSNLRYEYKLSRLF